VEKGQSMVEFSLILVFLLILLAGITDLGRALFTYMALRDAAQEGALYASINPSQTSAIKDRVYNSSDLLRNLGSESSSHMAAMSTSTTNSVSVTVSIEGETCAGNAVEVRVTYNDFPIAMPFLGTLLGSQRIKITATVSNTILTPACQ